MKMMPLLSKEIWSAKPLAVIQASGSGIRTIEKKHIQLPWKTGKKQEECKMSLIWYIRSAQHGWHFQSRTTEGRKAVQISLEKKGIGYRITSGEIDDNGTLERPSRGAEDTTMNI